MAPRNPWHYAVPWQGGISGNTLVGRIICVEGLLKAQFPAHDNICPSVVNLVDALDLGAVCEADLDTRIGGSVCVGSCLVATR